MTQPPSADPNPPPAGQSPPPPPTAKPAEEPPTDRATDPADSSDEELRGAFQSGAVSANGALESEAGHRLHASRSNVVFGGQTVGAMIFQNQEREIRPGELPTQVLEDLQSDAFVVCQGLTILRDETGGRHAFLLRASEGSGRTAAAIWLMLRRGAASIRVLRSEEPLHGQLDTPQPKTGYVLCDPAPTAGVTTHTINDLAARLEKIGSFFVAVVAAGSELAEAGLLDHLFELTESPTHDQVARSILQRRLGNRAVYVLSDPDVAKLIRLNGRFPLRFAAEIAELIARATTDNGSVDVAGVSASFAKRREEEFGIWFKDLSKAGGDALYFAVALAVLDGLSPDEIRPAAESLRKRLAPGGGSVVVSDGGRSATVSLSSGTEHMSLSEQLRLVRAEVVHRKGHDDVAPMRVVQFRSGDYPERTIRRTSREYGPEPLLGWLDGLIGNKTSSVRVWAATAVGVLCTESFEHVVNNLIDKWARGTDETRQRLAATALAVAAGEEQCRGPVRALLQRWFEDEESPNVRATAAIAYGRAFATIDPDLAIARLHRLAAQGRVRTRAKIRLALAVGDSIGSMIVERIELVDPLLAAIVYDWLPDDEREEVGTLAFLQVASGVITTVHTEGQLPVVWPTLLRRSIGNRGVQEALTAAWVHVLTRSSLPPKLQIAEDVLWDWAKRAESDPTARGLFGALVQHIARRAGEQRMPSLRGELLYECDRWADPNEVRYAPRTAAEVRTRLQGEG